MKIYDTCIIYYLFLASWASYTDSLNFNDILKENSQYEPAEAHCFLRVVGGKKVPIEHVPYQVLLRRSAYFGFYWFEICGGSLITLKFVLTAAHCFQTQDKSIPAKSIRIVAGTTRSKASAMGMNYEAWRRINYFYIHAFYDPVTLEHDISLIETQGKFFMSNSIKPIRMQMPHEASTGTHCLVSGFGRLSSSSDSEVLKMACIPIISNFHCRIYYQFHLIPPSKLCAGGIQGTGPCQGDSGGPLVCGGVLVGIVSSGIVCAQEPALFMKVLFYTSSDSSVPFVLGKGCKCSGFVFLIVIYVCILFGL